MKRRKTITLEWLFGIVIGLLLFSGTIMIHMQNAQGAEVQDEGVDPEQNGQQETPLLNYIYVDESYLEAPATQNIVASIGTETTQIDAATLWLQKQNGEVYSLEAQQLQQDAILFSEAYEGAEQQGIYSLVSIDFQVQGIQYSVQLADAGMNISYGVNEYVATNPDAYVENEEEGNEGEWADTDEGISVLSLEDALDENTYAGANSRSSKIVVVLDPGHGGTDPGTSSGSLVEKELTLKIAQYAKQKLETYAGVEVYLTRSTDTYVSLEDRVTYAKNVNANYFVSIHINAATAASANGAEVYYPNSNYNSSIGAQGKELASQILSQLVSLGLNNRGTKISNSSDYTYPDGSKADLYSVIRNSKLQGIPAVLIEHAFITNASDYAYLSSDANLQQLGNADAIGIANYLNLSSNALSVKCTQENDKVTVSAEWQPAAEGIQYRYLCYDVAAGTWQLLSEWTMESSIDWKPAAGNYWIQVTATDKNGTMLTETIETQITRNYSGVYSELEGICYILNDDSVDIGAAYVSNDPDIQFRWLAYDLNKQEWKLISDWSNGNWSTWKPEVGNYWLHVEAMTSDGEINSQTINFNSSKDYAHHSLELNGIGYIVQDNGIDVGVAYHSSDPNVSFRWLSYDLNKQEWKLISDWANGNWSTWKPEIGNYWLRVEAMTSDGKTADQTVCFDSSKDYAHNPLELQGICDIIRGNSIDAGVAYTSSDPDVLFRWLVYDLDKQEWELLSDWKSGNWITWEPKKGNYWLRVEAVTSDGVEKDLTIAYTADRDYGRNYISLGGICRMEDKAAINLGVVYDTNDSAPLFRWQIYNLASGQWSLLSDWNSGNWVSWYPESGNYWIYVEAKTSDGTQTNYCIEYQVTARYAVMGKSNATLAQMVSYFNANSTYPAFYSSSDAAALEDLCRIYIEECEAEGVRAEVAFAQAMLETGFLKYGGDVDISQYNFAGLGATGGVPGNSYSSVREGVRAQIQHLKAYASTEPLNNACVDNRFSYVKRGTAPYVEWLGIQENPYGTGWASAKNYGYTILNNYIARLLMY